MESSVNLTCLALLAGLAAFCTPMRAHHGSRVSYDVSQKVTLTGTVAQYIWANPHVSIIFDVTDKKGTVVSWGAETYAPVKMARSGWTSTSLKPGDQVTVTVFRSRLSATRGFLERLVFPDGKVTDLGDPTE
jgi:hypothetical protein